MIGKKAPDAGPSVAGCESDRLRDSISHRKLGTRVTQTARELLHSSVLRALVKRVEQHGMILRHVQEALPIALAEHCKSCLADGGRLVIFTDSPAWASQLRFYAPVILARLRTACGDDFREMQVRNLRLEAPADGRKPARAPSPETAHLVQASGHSTSSDQLREALLRLGATMARYAG
jgi:hypothetical protein